MGGVSGNVTLSTVMILHLKLKGKILILGNMSGSATVTYDG